ncbi:MAG: helix-turn-helix transcriptional regulator [Saprospiraceae bacterium]|nr:helix-turn-helix transcriptional regulator [Saprospiraceae bacterium]
MKEKNSVETARIENRMMLAAKIFEAMQRQGISKSKLAEMLEQHPSVVTKWLSGTHNFTTDTLSDIGRVLKIQLFAHNVEQPKQLVIERTTVVHGAIEKPLDIGFQFSGVHFNYYKTPLFQSGNYSGIPLMESLKTKRYA